VILNQTAAQTASFHVNGTGRVESALTAGNGIGVPTVSPAPQLVVNGAGYAYADFIDGNNEMAIGIDTTGNTGFIATVDSALSVRTGGGERIHINDSGQVGIGNGGPSQALVVGPSSNLTGLQGGTHMMVSEAGTTQAVMEARNDSVDLVSFVNASVGALFTLSGNPLVFGTFNAERMRIGPTGNVGIGNSNPSQALVVGPGANGSMVAGGGTRIMVSESNATVALTEVRNSNVDITMLAGASEGVITTRTNSPLVFQTNGANDRMFIDSSGHVAIGFPATTPITYQLAVGGLVYAQRFDVSGGPDVAENITATEPTIEAGDVVAADPRGGERVVKSKRPYQQSLLGVISTDPSVVANASRLNNLDATQRPLALAGRVPVKVTAEGGPIAPGDLLTSSSVPGHAMRAAESWRGGVIGLALEAFDGKKGQSGKVIVFLRDPSPPTADPQQVASLRAELDRARAELATLKDLSERLSRLEQAPVSWRAAELSSR
jgi:hypothetical protein